MNIDKNLIKYWSYLCESEENKYNDYNDEPIQLQYAIEQNAGYDIIFSIFYSLHIAFEDTKEYSSKIFNFYNASKDFDNIDIEFGGMSMIQKKDSGYVLTEQCKEIFLSPNINFRKVVKFFENTPIFGNKLANDLTKQFKNKIKLIKTEPLKVLRKETNKKNYQDFRCKVEIKPGKYEAYADNVSFGKVKSGTFKITLESHTPTKIDLSFMDDSRGGENDYIIGHGDYSKHVNLANRIKLNFPKPLIPKESKEPNYDVFTPGDKPLTNDELEKQISLLDDLSKEFKKNPDEGIKLLTRNKKLLGITFEMWSFSMKQLMARNKKEN